MVAEIEAVGDILTGALVSRAVEPEAGEGQAGDVASCLNCSGDVIGNHCHSCGQKAKVHRTLGAFGHDILHSVLHFDGKIWRTLPLLAWYPGELTRRYVHGERAKFVSPIALFLFSVFLSFAAFNLLAPSNLGTDKPVTPAEAATEYAKDRKDILDDIKELEKDKADAIAEKQASGWMDGEIARHRERLKELDDSKGDKTRQAEIANQKFLNEKRKIEADIARLEAKLTAARAAGTTTKALEDELKSERLGLKLMTAASTLVTQNEHGVSSKIDVNFFGSDRLNAAAKHAVENPQLLIYKIQSNAYKYSWALIPISVPFVWLLFFWRREFKLFDHAVFVTYSLCFMLTFAMLGGTILTLTSEGSFVFVVTVLALIFFPPIHMYRQIHRGYGTTRFGALWRTFLLSNFAVIALSLFASLIFTLGVTG
jgi:Protein of unknown function (DUF3667)